MRMQILSDSVWTSQQQFCKQIQLMNIILLYYCFRRQYVNEIFATQKAHQRPWRVWATFYWQRLETGQSLLFYCCSIGLSSSLPFDSYWLRNFNSIRDFLSVCLSMGPSRMRFSKNANSRKFEKNWSGVGLVYKFICYSFEWHLTRTIDCCVLRRQINVKFLGFIKSVTTPGHMFWTHFFFSYRCWMKTISSSRQYKTIKVSLVEVNLQTAYNTSRFYTGISYIWLHSPIMGIPIWGAYYRPQVIILGGYIAKIIHS